MKVLREQNTQGTDTNMVTSFEMIVFLLVSVPQLAQGYVSIAI